LVAVGTFAATAIVAGKLLMNIQYKLMETTDGVERRGQRGWAAPGYTISRGDTKRKK